MGIVADVAILSIGAVYLISAVSLNINVKPLLWLCGSLLILLGVLSCTLFPWMRIAEAVVLFLFALYQLLNLGVFLAGCRAGCPYAICVPGAQVRRDEISRTFRQRLDLAAEQYRKFHGAPYIIICGAAGSENPVPEAEIGADYLAKNGVSPDKLKTEPDSFNTLKSLENVRALLEEKDAPILIATSGWGMLRAWMLAKRVGLNAEVVGCRTAFLWYMSYSLREMPAVVCSLFGLR